MRLPLLVRSTKSVWSARRENAVLSTTFVPGRAQQQRSTQSTKFWSNNACCSRSFTTTIPKDDEKKSDTNDMLVKQWRDPSLKGVGQVIFLNDIKSGAIILGSLAIGDPYLATLAALGSVTSNGIAHTTKLDSGAKENGLWAYNGCLMGCVSAVFVAPQSALIGVASTLTGATLATFVTAAVPKAMGGNMPQWTFAFNIVALTQLLRVQPLKVDEAAAEAVATTAATTTVSMSSVLATPLVGISQIFVVENVWTGAGIVAAIATYSPQLAMHAVAGSTVGALTGLSLGIPAADVTAGLCGFNSALTSMGVAVFFQHSPATVALSLGGAAATAATFAGFKEVFFNLGASPCLTLPFCVTMTGCYLLSGTIPSLKLAKTPHSPEKNGGDS